MGINKEVRTLLAAAVITAGLEGCLPLPKPSRAEGKEGNKTAQPASHDPTRPKVEISPTPWEVGGYDLVPTREPTSLPTVFKSKDGQDLSLQWTLASRAIGGQAGSELTVEALKEKYTIQIEQVKGQVDRWVNENGLANKLDASRDVIITFSADSAVEAQVGALVKVEDRLYLANRDGVRLWAESGALLLKDAVQFVSPEGRHIVRLTGGGDPDESQKLFKVEGGLGVDQLGVVSRLWKVDDEGQPTGESSLGLIIPVSPEVDSQQNSIIILGAIPLKREGMRLREEIGGIHTLNLITGLVEVRNTDGEVVAHWDPINGQFVGEGAEELVLEKVEIKAAPLELPGLATVWNAERGRYEYTYVDEETGETKTIAYWGLTSEEQEKVDNGEEIEARERLQLVDDLTAIDLAKCEGLFVDWPAEKADEVFASTGKIALSLPKEGEFIERRSLTWLLCFRNVPAGTLIRAPFSGKIMDEGVHGGVRRFRVVNSQLDLAFTVYVVHGGDLPNTVAAGDGLCLTGSSLPPTFGLGKFADCNAVFGLCDADYDGCRGLTFADLAGGEGGRIARLTDEN